MNISPEKQIGLPAIILPMVVLLCWGVPWEGDPRTGPIPERLLQLKKSRWSWDQAEYQRMLDTIDVNQLVDGVPLFVKLAIDARDQEMLQRMLARGADVNSSNWGCTPLLRALEIDKESLKDAPRRDPELALLVLRAGANPALRPSLGSVEKRLATGVPKDACAAFDDLKLPNASTLRIVAKHYQSRELLELMVQKGARPIDRVDAQAMLGSVVRDWLSGYLDDNIIRLARSYGASLDYAFGDSRLSEGTALSEAMESGSGVDGIRRVLRHGADPNRRIKNGTLPLHLAVARCASVRLVYGIERENETNPFMLELIAKDWRQADKEAQRRNADVLQMIATLLEAGANPNLPLKADGGSILTYAVGNCSSDVTRLLLAYKAKVTSDAIKAARFDQKSLLQSHAGIQ